MTKLDKALKRRTQVYARVMHHLEHMDRDAAVHAVLGWISLDDIEFRMLPTLDKDCAKD